MSIEVARARDDSSLLRVAGLRWRWVGERGSQQGTAEAYAAALVGWANAHRETHAAFLATRDSEAVGMLWVALQPRVPSPGQLERLNAEVQSVYVVPEARRAGVGAALMGAAMAWIRESGAEHAIVHSSDEALRLYAAAGFGPSRLLLDREL